MKKVFFLVSIIAVIFLTSRLFTNPIVERYINEFGFTDSGWTMEFHPNISENSFDGWFITSLTDTTFFKDGMSLNYDEYITINNDSLKKELYINPEGDIITLHRPDSNYADGFTFGDLKNTSISAPKPGYSICRTGDYYYYFDKTPTFGFENDTSDINGFVEGYVKDSLGNPIENVKVIYAITYSPYPYNYVDTIFVLTNSDGYFKFKSLARIKFIDYLSDNFSAPQDTVQIWPDSTVSINVQMKLIVGVVEKVPSKVPSRFELTQNYPNPFNPSTKFYFTVPKESYIEINVYDEKGALVKNLFSGTKSTGTYKMNWNAGNLASGVYIYELKGENFSISKKMILMK